MNVNNFIMIIGFISFPEKEIAKKVAKEIVYKNLVACAKIISNIESVYIWEGKVQEESEVYLMLKSRLDKVGDIKSILDKEHPYKVYEFLYHEVKSGNDKYTQWIEEMTRGQANDDKKYDI